MARSLAPSSVLDVVVLSLADGVVTEQSFERLVDVMQRFVLFLDGGCGLADLRGVSRDLVERFVTSSTTAGTVPSPSVMHLRRCAVRMLFRVARELGVADTDPTVDLVLPGRQPAAPRPLADEEVAICRAMSIDHVGATRLSAAWAFAEAGVRTGELANITIGDVDLDTERVWIAGCRSTLPRWVELTEWAHTQVCRRLGQLPSDDSQSVVYTADGSAKSRQAASCIAVSMTLARAGLGNDPSVRPVSVAGWAGRKVMERTGRLEDVATALGMRSLDRAARLIGHDWSAGGR